MVSQRAIRIYKFASKLTIAGFFMMVWAFPTITNAFVIVSNQEGIVPANGQTTITFFQSPKTYESGAYLYYESQVKNTSGFPSCANGMYFDLSASTSLAFTIAASNIQASTSTTEWQNVSGSLLLDQNLVYGNTYYLIAHTQCNPGNFEVRNFLLKDENTTTIPTTQASKNIEILNPTYGTTTATTTFTVQIRYNTPFTLDFRPTTTRHFEIVDAITGELNYEYNATITPNTSENITINATTTTSEGSKFIRAMYLDVNGNAYSEIDEVFFNVATNTYYAITGLESPRDNVSDLSQINCDLFDVGCQFQKAITFLFVPPASTLDKWSNLWQNISEKKPFGYVTVTLKQLEQLDDSGSSAFDLGTIPFMDSMFTPFRTLIAGILWALFAIFFFQRRLIHLDI